MPLTKPLTLSPARTSSYTPSKPPQLTISTHCQPQLSPTNSLTQCPKRRKLNLPPSVEYYASNTNLSSGTSTAHPTPAVRWTNTPTAKNSITTRKAPGTHIWHGFLLHENKFTGFWAFHKFNGSEEYNILQEILDFKDTFIVKKLTTGEEFTVLLPDKSRLRS